MMRRCKSVCRRDGAAHPGVTGRRGVPFLKSLAKKYSGKVVIGVKDGKYRITVHTIMLTGNIGYKNITEKDKLTSYAAKNNGTILNPEWCKPNTLGLLDKAFTDKLQYIPQEKKIAKDDW